MRVIIKSDSLDFSSSGNVTGRISFSDGNRYFPEEDWNDFVVPVLWWWLDALAKIDESVGGQTLEFMDGPLAVVVQSLGDEDSVQLQCLNQGIVTFETVCSLDALVESIIEAAKIVVERAEEIQWSSPDLKSLQVVIDAY